MRKKKSSGVRRVNILLGEEQYHKVTREGLNLSGLIRDLLTDRFSEKLISLSVQPKTRALYDNIVSNFGVSDAEIEEHFKDALDQALKEKISAINSVRAKLK